MTRRPESAQGRWFEAANNPRLSECEPDWEGRRAPAWSRRCLARVHQVQLRLLSWAMRRLGILRGYVLLRGNGGCRRAAKLIHQFAKRGHNFVPEDEQHPKNAGDARGDGHHLIGAGIERD